MTNITNAQVVKPIPTWVAEAAARAEERSRGVPAHPTPLKQLHFLIAAIMNPRVNREELRAIAKAMTGGRA